MNAEQSRSSLVLRGTSEKIHDDRLGGISDDGYGYAYNDGQGDGAGLGGYGSADFGKGDGDGRSIRTDSLCLTEYFEEN